MYFARKFEAIVNQDVINELDAYLYGNYPEGKLIFTNDIHTCYKGYIEDSETDPDGTNRSLDFC